MMDVITASASSAELIGVRSRIAVSASFAELIVIAPSLLGEPECRQAIFAAECKEDSHTGDLCPITCLQSTMRPFLQLRVGDEALRQGKGRIVDSCWAMSAVFRDGWNRGIALAP